MSKRYELYLSARDRWREEVRDTRREQDAVLEREAEARENAHRAAEKLRAKPAKPH